MNDSFLFSQLKVIFQTSHPHNLTQLIALGTILIDASTNMCQISNKVNLIKIERSIKFFYLGYLFFLLDCVEVIVEIPRVLIYNCCDDSSVDASPPLHRPSHHTPHR